MRRWGGVVCWVLEGMRLGCVSCRWEVGPATVALDDGEGIGSDHRSPMMLPAMDHGKNSGSNVAAAYWLFVSDQGHDMNVARWVNSVLSFVRVHSP